MKILLRLIVILSCSICPDTLIAQDQQSIEYLDGLYTNINMVISNSPIPSRWIETDVRLDDRDFFTKLTKAKEIVFFDHNGVRSTMATDSIWGFCQNGDLHINIYKDFHRIDYVGRISHFIARKSTFVDYQVRGRHPRTISFLTIQVIIKNTGYLVDLFEDKVFEFNAANLERVLEDDPQLLNEYMSLNKRKKEKMKFIFLRRYNEKYPLDSHKLISIPTDS